MTALDMQAVSRQIAVPLESANSKRLNAVDALRGIAALCVVVYHARSSLWTGIRNLYSEYGFNATPGVWVGYATYPFSFGWLGVTLFFVLSGYCIHRRGARILSQDEQVKLNWRGFFKRRFWRIYPTYVAALLVGGLIDYYLLTATSLAEPRQASYSIWSFVATLFSFQGYVAPFFGTNMVFWTLAMELHLYLVYPVLFIVSKRYGPAQALAIVAVITVAFDMADAVFGIQASFPYRFMRGPIFLPYWFTWAVGFYLAEVEAGRARLPAAMYRRLLVGLAICSGICLTLLNRAEYSEVFWAIAAGGVVWWSLGASLHWLWESVVGRLFVFVGMFSYSLYAVHFPAIVLFKSWALPSGEKPDTLVPTVLGVSFAIVFSYMFFLLVERWSISPMPSLRQACLNRTKSG